ncbi:MAG: winged helix-turn-helix domain-containing protein [Acidobacteriota bacterium]
MIEEPNISRLARTIGDTTRIRMLTLLMQGRALTAKELAYGSGVEPATATAHLQRLEGDGFVNSTTQGRHKYFSLASADVARLIESLMVVAPQTESNSTKKKIADPVRLARFCYDHLAGKLGTHLREELLSRNLLIQADKAFFITTDGEQWFQSFGIDLSALRRSRRQFAYQCLDWSERKDHVAGALAAALAQRMITLGWITRNKNSRIVSITKLGQKALAEQLGFSISNT